MTTSFGWKRGGREMVCKCHYGTCCIATSAFSGQYIFIHIERRNRLTHYFECCHANSYKMLVDSGSKS